MKPRLRLLAAILVIASIIQDALADGLADRAGSFVSKLREQASRTLQIALNRLASAQADLHISEAVSRDASQANDQAAISVAAQATEESTKGLSEAEQLVRRARTLVMAREKALEDLRASTLQTRKPGVLTVPVEGDVRVHKPDGPPATDPLEAGAGGDRIETGPQGRARLFVADGDGEIDMHENSLFTVGRNDPNSGFTGILEKGFARVRLLIKPYTKKKFEIRTPSAVAAVRGTDFSVKVQEDGDWIQVFEGSVQVTPISGGDGVTLSAGHQQRFRNGQAAEPAQVIDATEKAPWSTDGSEH
jgi:ferric-dicitrate binding protein FerR (iron transport regulator)